MPNHVSHIVEFSGNQEQIDVLFSFIKGKFDDDDENEMHIDFEKILPFPKELKGTCSPPNIVSQEEYNEWIRKRDNNELHPFEKDSRPLTQEISDDLIQKYGYNNWYDWRCSNWNTKWNAYDQNRSGNEISFDTAWSTPYPIFQKLSELFPEVKITVQFADEDFGYNCGTYIYEEGENVFEDLPAGGSFEAYLFANEIKSYYNNIDEVIEQLNELDDDNFDGEYYKFYFHLFLKFKEDLTQENINDLREKALESVINSLKELSSDENKNLIDKLEENLDNKLTFF
mgnify:CR=1 FL=1